MRGPFLNSTKGSSWWKCLLLVSIRLTGNLRELPLFAYGCVVFPLTENSYFGFALPQLPCLNGREFIGRVVKNGAGDSCRLAVGDQVSMILNRPRTYHLTCVGPGSVYRLPRLPKIRLSGVCRCVLFQRHQNSRQHQPLHGGLARCCLRHRQHSSRSLPWNSTSPARQLVEHGRFGCCSRARSDGYTLGLFE